MSRLCGFNHRLRAALEQTSLTRWVLIPFLAVALSARAGDQPASTISREVKDIFDHCKKAVVKIHGADEHSELSGTGFFIDPTGTIYTAYSVGGEGSNFTIEFDGKKLPARQLVTDVRSGIAILKVDAASPSLPVGKSENMEVTTPVIAIGYPLDLPETPSLGLIGGLKLVCSLGLGKRDDRTCGSSDGKA